MGSSRMRQRPPIGLMGMLALIGLIEAGLASSGSGRLSYPRVNARWSAEAASRLGRRADVLIVGDSQAKFGLDPRRIVEGLDGAARGLNLAVPSSPTPLSYLLSSRALANGARPRAIVLCHMTLSGDPAAQAAELAEVGRPLELLRLARDARDYGLFLDLMLRRYLPSRGLRDAIRNPPTDSAARWVAEAPVTWALNDGAELVDPSRPFVGRLAADSQAAVFEKPWLVLPLYADYTRRLLDEAGRLGIPVIWVIAPVAPEAQAVRESQGFDAPHTRNLRTLAGDHPNLVVLDARDGGFLDADFVDSCHLNARGAARLSAAVAAAIRLREAGTLHENAWLAVPELGEPSDLLAVEPEPSVIR